MTTLTGSPPQLRWEKFPSPTEVWVTFWVDKLDGPHGVGHERFSTPGPAGETFSVCEWIRLRRVPNGDHWRPQFKISSPRCWTHGKSYYNGGQRRTKLDVARRERSGPELSLEKGSRTDKVEGGWDRSFTRFWKWRKQSNKRNIVTMKFSRLGHNKLGFVNLKVAWNKTVGIKPIVVGVKHLLPWVGIFLIHWTSASVSIDSCLCLEPVQKSEGSVPRQVLYFDEVHSKSSQTLQEYPQLIPGPHVWNVSFCKISL